MMSLTPLFKQACALAAIFSALLINGAAATHAGKSTSPTGATEVAAWACGPLRCYWHPNYYGPWSGHRHFDAYARPYRYHPNLYGQNPGLHPWIR